MRTVKVSCDVGVVQPLPLPVCCASSFDLQYMFTTQADFMYTMYSE